MSLDPVSVALQFGFLAVLYLFLVWVARSSLRDLRRADHRTATAAGSNGAAADATGLHRASGAPVSHDANDARLVVSRAPGHTPGMEYDIGEGAVMGRGDQAEIQLEDLGSTNGTYLNDELVRGPQPLHPGDRVRIGDSEFRYVDD